MIEEVGMVFNKGHYLYLFIITILLGICLCKSFRKSFFVPALFAALAVMNPITYHYWYSFSSWGYWRLLWILPIVFAFALFYTTLFEKAQQLWLKVMSIIVAIATCVLFGNPVYWGSNTGFVASDNADKLPSYVNRIGCTLLQLEDTPYVVTDSSLCPYLRQYSGAIKTMYARDVVFNGANTALADDVFQNLSQPDGDLSFVARSMLNNDYTYLVTKDLTREKAIESAGFRLIQMVDDYAIYKVFGNRTEVRTYNDKHQVLSVTLLDENGKIARNNGGYARYQNEYDENGQVGLTYYYDEIGNSVKCGSGYMHEYLQSIMGKGYDVFISVRSEASRNLTSVLVKDMKALGLKTDLRGKYRYSYFAVISGDVVVDEEDSLEVLQGTGNIHGYDYRIESAGYLAGRYSSIMINGEEYSRNWHGMNIVIVKDGKVIDSVGFDTYSNDIRFT